MRKKWLSTLFASLFIQKCQNICSKLSQICLTWSVVVEKIVICFMYICALVPGSSPLPPATIYEKNISVKMKFHWKQKLRKIFQLCIWSYVSKWTHCNKISCIWLKDLQKLLWSTLKKLPRYSWNTRFFCYWVKSLTSM